MKKYKNGVMSKLYTGILENKTLCCPQCNHPADAHSSIKEQKPRDGDISVCIKCAGINQYKSEGETFSLKIAPDILIQTMAKEYPDAYKELMIYATAVKIIQAEDQENKLQK